MFKNQKILSKTFLFAGGVLLLILFNSGMGLWGVFHIRKSTVRLENLSELLDKTQEVRLSISRLIMPANDFLIVGADLNERENFSSLLKKSNQRYEDFVEYLDSHPSVAVHAVHATNGGELFTEDIRQDITNIANWSLELFSSGKQGVVSGQLMEKIDREADDIIEETTVIIEHIKQDRNQVIAEAQSIRNAVMAIMIISLIVSLALLTAIQLFVVRAVILPMRNLSRTAKEIEDGDLTKRAKVESRDEIGQFARSFNYMVDSVIDRGKEVARLKDEFLFIVAHELRSPVTAIEGFLGLILEEKEDLGEDIKDNLEAIEEANIRLLALVNDFLKVARAESGKMKTLISSQDIGPIISSTIEGLEPLAAKKDILVRYEPMPELPLILGDSQKIEEILINLVGNAINYNKLGGSVTVHHELEDGFLVTHVSDTGIGLSDEDKKHLFEKFWRAENEATREITGTGLGLFITKELVERMNGKVRVESEEGKGSTFSFSLLMASKGK